MSAGVPSGICIIPSATVPGVNAQDAIHWLPVTAIVGCVDQGMKYRVTISPSASTGASTGATRPNFGVTESWQSPSPICAPACRRTDSIAAKKSRLASNCSRLSRPVSPKSAARAITIGIATSMHVTSISSNRSIRWPVGRKAPVDDPASSMKFSSTGAAVPGTPSMAASPA